MSGRKRIAYLINHKLLLGSECRLLTGMGFEVFVPKVFKDDGGVNFRSMIVDYQFDQTLSIPSAALDKLNRFDFYNDDFTDEVAELLNKYFDTVITAALERPVMNVASFFQGKVVIRLFGWEGDMNYEGVFGYFGAKINGIKRWFKPMIFKHYSQCLKIFYKIRDRLYFAVCYRSIIANETPFFKERSIYLPSGTYADNWLQENTWEGGVNKVMFVCPSIDNPYYKNVYDTFNENFGDIPHHIFGKQSREYPQDKNIVGYFLSREDFDRALKKYDAMFYHSREPRHIHNHPFEAIIFGMPLIFMSGGILEEFGGSSQPGMARTFAEAREKIKRVLAGDKEFISTIKKAQIKIIDYIRDEAVERLWRQNFLPWAIR
ncbi:hypothetical protein FACS1894139_15920 [Planctomycetales bacterium]|nr:hypothetical protein FACS1894107_13280 [Planctomycetales bacterium]GHT00413.1 hypothetical protein FACS1894108_12400 [Planctomycetales bacterium]GHT07505.1 hypothetical protein FACS1894139_15920 [Planctomycetales bacterium]